MQTVGGKEYKEPSYDYNDEGELEYFDFNDEPRDPTAVEFAGADFCYNVSPSEFTETAVMIADKGKVREFSFEERPYLKKIYDTGAQKTLLKAGRQTEKSQYFRALISMEDGSVKELQHVEVGDRVVGLSSDEAHTDIGEVTWVSRQYTKPCVEISTRQGHSTIVALTHPMRSWGAWDEAERLEVGHRLAVVRQGGCFVETTTECDQWIKIAAHMVAEGDTCGTPSFTQNEGVVLDDFLDAVEFHGVWFTPHERESKGGLSWQLNFVQGDERKENPIKPKLREWGIDEERSAERHVPNFVWGLNQRQTALFLNRLWAGDGHASLQNSSYALEYDSISARLTRDVQRILWKFGIPSSFRRWKPTLYKGTDKWAYKIRIETQGGVFRFISQIGALGKTEDLPLLEVDDRSNRDVFPLTVSKDIWAIYDSRKGPHLGRYVPQPSLRSVGLRRKPKYNLSRRKLQEYIDFFRSDNRFDQDKVEALAAHLDTDLFWNEIVSIKNMGEQPCRDITVKGTESFVGDGFITHNSTTLGNKTIAYSCLNNHFRSLFVAPSAEQAKVFSNDRIKEPIDVSPLVGAYTNTILTNAVFHKKFINYSQIRLRYAYLTADRVRGIPADLINVDEIQDILVDNIPVIEECASHSEWKLFIYSGTPKSLDNTLEHYWANFSTQNEWVVPCERHGTPNNPSSWHWNVLDEDNIGKKGLICDKCREPINPYHPMAQWAALNPQTKSNKDKVTFEGYRIPQIMVPWIVDSPDDNGWSSILEKQERYPRQKFHNEVLGISYDSGTRPLTRGQLKACCKDHIQLADFENFKSYAQGTDIFAGIDWGCHDEETRILTQDGWKHFRNLTDEDQVAQWDPDTRVMSLVKPEARTVREWDGPLYHFETKGALDMMLTGTHRMRTRASSKYKWKTERAEQTVRRSGARFVGHLNWGGVERHVFQLPGLPKSPGYSGCRQRTFRMDDWLEFLGYILSEGGVCMRKNKAGDLIPYHLKMSQRETVHPKQAAKIKSCMDRMGIPYSEFPNPNTGDLNWSINGKQYWHWFSKNMGWLCSKKRIPREFLSLPKHQLQILFDAMVLGDGYVDPRDGCDSGKYNSTSKGLCEDFQELCIRLGRRCIVRLQRPAEGNRKALWAALWSHGRDFRYNSLKQRVKTIPYEGNVYCCKVPTGYIVTERNGCVAYQGNSGENSYTVISLGAYLGTGNFTIFWAHRFTGRDLEPPIQLDAICTLLTQFNVCITGCDYGGGFDRNDHLIRTFGPNKILKYQYNPQQKRGKVYWEERLHRFAVHRTEVMSDVFNAIVRKQFDFPCWDDFNDPYGQDILNIFSEKNEQRRMIEYKHAPGTTDDTFHSILYCFLASMIKYPRPDIIAPFKDTGEDFNPRRRR